MSAPGKPRWLKWPFADTLFARLFAILIAVILLGQFLVVFLVFNLMDLTGNGHPPRDMVALEMAGALPPPPRPGEQPSPAHEPRPGEPGPGFEKPGLAGTGAPKPGFPLPPQHRFWWGFVVQLLGLAIAAAMGARLMARPIQELGRAARRLGEDLSAPPIPEQGPVEARQAAQTFNRMQDQIRQQLDERHRFLAAVSHDLRTPLTRMKLRLEQMPEGEWRSRFGGDLAEMALMLDATLDYLRGQSRGEAFRLFDVESLIQSLVEDAKERGADVEMAGHAAPIRALPLALRSCFTNLMENALRYAGDARFVLIDTSDSLTVQVRDHGPGIAPEFREAVFEPFYRLEGSRNRGSGGTGLGLAIAREVARKHGGDIVLREAEGGGLVASVTLPRR